MNKKLMLLGSGELGKEVTISAKRLGCQVIAVDRYAGAPAMQVADAFEVINMLDGSELERVVRKAFRPHIVVAGGAEDGVPLLSGRKPVDGRAAPRAGARGSYSHARARCSHAGGAGR